MRTAAIVLLAALTLSACASFKHDPFPKWAEPAWESKGGGGE